MEAEYEGFESTLYYPEVTGRERLGLKTENYILTLGAYDIGVHCHIKDRNPSGLTTFLSTVLGIELGGRDVDLFIGTNLKIRDITASLVRIGSEGNHSEDGREYRVDFSSPVGRHSIVL